WLNTRFPGHRRGSKVEVGYWCTGGDEGREGILPSGVSHCRSAPGARAAVRVAARRAGGRRSALELRAGRGGGRPVRGAGPGRRRRCAFRGGGQLAPGPRRRSAAVVVEYAVSGAPSRVEGGGRLLVHWRGRRA